MKLKILAILVVILLGVSSFLAYGFLVNNPTEKGQLDMFVGISVAYDDMAQIKKLVDEVNGYTNLFVIGCTGITYNATKLDETCKYLYDKDLSFIVFRDTRLRNSTWLESAKKRWPDKFLGFYAYDEVGGYQLDKHIYRMVSEADNYTDAATQFVNTTNRYLNSYSRFRSNQTSFSLFTADYALYWFDYKAGYDVVLAEFGWNYSRQLNVALCRGAATIQEKDWGVMITWENTAPPYIESGQKLYQDLVQAYDNGAKYAVIFDSDENYTRGILQEEHLQALRQFWLYAQDNPRTNTQISERVAYVLPKDYAYGFRGPYDKIWGIWETDPPANPICRDLNVLLEKYGNKLDIIYDDGLEANSTQGYNRIVFANGTQIVS